MLRAEMDHEGADHLVDPKTGRQRHQPQPYDTERQHQKKDWGRAELFTHLRTSLHQRRDGGPTVIHVYQIRSHNWEWANEVSYVLSS